MSFLPGSPFADPQGSAYNPYASNYTGPANPQGDPTPGGSSVVPPTQVAQGSVTGDPALDADLTALGLSSADLQGASDALLKFIAGQVAQRRAAPQAATPAPGTGTPATPATPGAHTPPAPAPTGAGSTPAPGHPAAQTTPAPALGPDGTPKMAYIPPPPVAVDPARSTGSTASIAGAPVDPAFWATATAKMQAYVNHYLAIPVAQRTPAQNAALAIDQATLATNQQHLAAAQAAASQPAAPTAGTAPATPATAAQPAAPATAPAPTPAAAAPVPTTPIAPPTVKQPVAVAPAPNTSTPTPPTTSTVTPPTTSTAVAPVVTQPYGPAQYQIDQAARTTYISSTSEADRLAAAKAYVAPTLAQQSYDSSQVATDALRLKMLGHI